MSRNELRSWRCYCTGCDRYLVVSFQVVDRYNLVSYCPFCSCETLIGAADVDLRVCSFCGHTGQRHDDYGECQVWDCDCSGFEGDEDD